VLPAPPARIRGWRGPREHGSDDVALPSGPRACPLALGSGPDDADL